MDEKRQVLIVDDNYVNRSLLKKQLGSLYEIIESSEGKEALEILQNDKMRISIVLLDLIMPVMDGYEFLRRKQELKEYSDIPVIVLSGDSSEKAERKALRLGANDFLTKPYRKEIILLRVENLIQLVENRELAQRDLMTTLLNRISFEEAVNEAVQEEESGTISAFLLIDVDDFKSINDTMGHAVGDEVLRFMAMRLKALFRTSDLIGRLGGDELAVYVQDIPNDVFAYSRGERICDAMKSWRRNERFGEVTCSVGIAIWPRHGQDFESLYKNADVALYSAKDRGKNQCAIYQSAYTPYRLIERTKKKTGVKNHPLMLIVDDIESNRQMLVSNFEDEYAILEAGDGVEAKEILEVRSDISIMMLDLIMPNMDGFELLEYLNESSMHKNLTIVVTTAYDEVENQMRALELGAYDVVGKPYNMEIIKRRMNNLMEHARMQELSRQYQIDTLTGISNREGFYRATRDMLDENPDEHFIIISSNIRNFKLLNELLGVETGDRLLRGIAAEIHSIPHKLKTMGRLQSDNFVMCFPKSELRVEKLLELSDNYIQKNEVKFKYTMNFGIYEIVDMAMSIGMMCDRAKEAMDSVKNNYMQPYAYYTGELRQKIFREQQLIDDMRSALVHHEFEVYYQPIIDIYTDRIVTIEGVTRWNNREGEIIFPSEFIPVFEKNGFIYELDRYVLEAACKEIAERLAENKVVVPVSINLSRVDFFKSNLHTELTSIVDRHQIPHQYIRFEVTESAYANNEIQMIEIVKELKKEGFTILMDDFGSGYSTFNILKDIPVDILKMDLRFLSDIDSNPKATGIITAIIRMAKWLNMRVIAEGVETAEQKEFLRRAGCDKYQGLLYSKPVPRKELDKLLTKDTVITYDEYQEKMELINFDYYWDGLKDINAIFEGLIGGMGLYEIRDDKIAVIRANNGYREVMGQEKASMLVNNNIPVERFDPENVGTILKACRKVEHTNQIEILHITRGNFEGRTIHVEIRIRHLHTKGDRASFYFSIREV